MNISLLIEQKSYPGKYAPVQIGAYIFSAFQRQIQNKEPLTLVIPILLYHGKAKWQYRTLAEMFGHLDEQWKQYMPSFNFIYNDLNALSDEEMNAIKNKFLAASFLTLKHTWEKEWLEKHALRLFILASEASKGLKKGFIIYLAARSNLNENLLFRYLNR